MSLLVYGYKVVLIFSLILLLISVNVGAIPLVWYKPELGTYCHVMAHGDEEVGLILSSRIE